MHRLILDTNVIVSGLIQKSFPHLILAHCLEGKATVCVSSVVFQEYVNVLERPKFSRFPDFILAAQTLIGRLKLEAEIFEPKETVSIIQDDADNRFLELAQASKADFLITGNHNDFNMEEFEETKIVSPKIYWEKHKQ